MTDTASRVKKLRADIYSKRQRLEYRRAFGSLASDPRWETILRHLEEISSDKVEALRTLELPPYKIGRLQGQLDIIRVLQEAHPLSEDEVASYAQEIASLQEELDAIQQEAGVQDDPVSQFLASF